MVKRKRKSKRRADREIFTVTTPLLLFLFSTYCIHVSLEKAREDNRHSLILVGLKHDGLARESDTQRLTENSNSTPSASSINHSGQGECQAGYCVTLSVVTNANSTKRFRSLRRLLQSIKNADYSSRLPQEDIPLILNLDTSTSDEVFQYVKEFDWELGRKEIRRRVFPGGVIAAVSEAWYPASDNEVGLLLEDDIELSPLYFTYLKLSMKTANPSVDPSILGISLYTPKRVEAVYDMYTFDTSKLIANMTQDPTMPFFQQLPCSWGAIYYAPHWQEFIAYLKSRLPFVDEEKPESHSVIQPGLIASLWAHSWKKYMIELMYIKGWYMLYPSYPNQTSLSTNHLEVGVHIENHDRFENLDDFLVPLMTTTVFDRLSRLRKDLGMTGGLFEAPRLDKIPMLDAASRPFATLDYLSALDWNQRLGKGQQENYLYHFTQNTTGRQVISSLVGSTVTENHVKRNFPPLRRKKICHEFSRSTNSLVNDPGRATLIISTFDRLDLLRTQLDYYTRSEVISTVLVIWQNQEYGAPPPMHINGKMALFLPQADASLNNKFLPNMKIVTEAILVIDDHTKLHLDDIDLLFEVWQQNNMKLVGFLTETLGGVDQAPSLQRQALESAQEPYNVTLANAFILNKRYLEEYSCTAHMAPLRALVDEMEGCEDMAMNFLVRLMTRREAPLYVEPLHQIGDFGMPSHYRDRRRTYGSQNDFRADCVSRLVKRFQRGPSSRSLLPAVDVKVQHEVLVDTMNDARKIRLFLAKIIPTQAFSQNRSFVTKCAYNESLPYPWFELEPKQGVTLSLLESNTRQESPCVFDMNEGKVKNQFEWYVEKEEGG